MTDSKGPAGTVTVPAGRYYIGHPSYVLRGKDYRYLREDTEGFKSYVGFSSAPDQWDREIVTFPVAHNGRIYFDGDGMEYYVDPTDEPIIALVPARIWELMFPDRAKEWGRVVEFTEETVCFLKRCDGAEVLAFGDIVIDTSDWKEFED